MQPIQFNGIIVYHLKIVFYLKTEVIFMDFLLEHSFISIHLICSKYAY